MKNLKDFFNKSDVQSIIALVIIFFCLYCLAFVKLTIRTETNFGTYIMFILGFYFGSMINKNNNQPQNPN